MENVLFKMEISVLNIFAKANAPIGARAWQIYFLSVNYDGVLKLIF